MISSLLILWISALSDKKYFYLFIIFIFCFFFRASPTAYGSSQAENCITAVAATLATAKDWTQVLMDISQVRYCRATMGTHFLNFWFVYFLVAPLACGSSQASDQTHAIAVTRAMAVTALNPLSHQGTPKKSFYKKYFIVCSLLFWSEINRGQNYKWCNFKN